MILDAVVLAAGAGARFGGGKLTAPWRGGILLDGALAVALSSPVETVIVVHGADIRVPDAARAFFRENGALDRLRLVHARDHERGLSASLAAGIADVADDRDGAFVFLGDMPSIPPETTSALVDALLRDGAAAAPLWRGRRGHPVLFGRSLFAALMNCVGDGGAREVLQTLGDQLVTVAASDDGVIIDVDEPGDLERLRLPG